MDIKVLSAQDLLGFCRQKNSEEHQQYRLQTQILQRSSSKIIAGNVNEGEYTYEDIESGDRYNYTSNRINEYSNDMSEDVDIYELVQYFIQSNPDGHFILDECPFIGSKGTF